MAKKYFAIYKPSEYELSNRMKLLVEYQYVLEITSVLTHDLQEI